MRVAVYTIAKNEAQFVQRWADSCVDADYRLILDTGSTDDTVALAEAAGVTVKSSIIDPWRFDLARNVALSLVPDVDYCIALDMDEVLVPGWRQHLEGVSCTRPRYQYTWSWNEDGSQVLVTDGIVETQEWIGLEIHHFPDHSKSRGQYFPLLRLAVEEDPEDDRNAYYFARELFFHGFYDEARAAFLRHLSLPRARWEPERAASMRYLAKITGGDEGERWLLRAAGECPWRREAWVDLASHYYSRRDWPACYSAALRALHITQKPLEYICEAFAWGSAPHDFAALSAYHLGLHDEAVRHGEAAVELDPHESRLRENLNWYRGANR